MSERASESSASRYDLLDGVRVVELSMYAFAPSCAAVLADWGADVIKVVPPHLADPMKGTPIATITVARERCRAVSKVRARIIRGNDMRMSIKRCRIASVLPPQ